MDALPWEVTNIIAVQLPPTSVAAVVRTCRSLRHQVSTDDVWSVLLARFFADAKLKSPHSRDAMAVFGKLAARPCRKCHRALTTPEGYRCACVPRRVRLPLTVGFALDNSSAAIGFRTSGGLPAYVQAWCDCELRRVERLDRRTLASVDVLILCTNRMPATAQDELIALRAWFEQGGALILSESTSSAARFAAHEPYVAEQLQFLGLEPLPRYASLTSLYHHDAAGDLLGIPFKPVPDFVETSFFRVAAFKEYQRLITTFRFTLGGSHATLVLPRKGVAGRCLVCTGYWGAIVLSGSKHQKHLLLNFIAGALAHRGGPIH